MKLLLVLTLGLAAVAAVPFNAERIVGGTITDISAYPFGASLAVSLNGVTFFQICGASIINNRSLLSAAHCFFITTAHWRTRVGSNYVNSGGSTHIIQSIFNHPAYNPHTLDNDISVLRITGAFSFNNNVQPGAIAGPNYNLPDNTPVWAIGWGATSFNGPLSEHLRHVQIWTVNHAICTANYAEIGLTVTQNMLCAGWLNVGGRDQCQGDSGGPLTHNNVIVGVCSWGEECALPRFPGVNARVSLFTSWIQGLA